MAIVGTRNVRVGQGYARDPLYEFASSFRDVARSLMQESGVDIFSEPAKTLVLESADDTMENFFVDDSYDEDSMDAEEVEDHIEMMKEQYENNKQAILEYAPMSSFNPVMGMTFPMHKNILMNNLFDKGGIQKAVAVTPKFTLSMERRILVTPDGKEIDIYLDQDKIKAAMDAVSPYTEVELNLPENSSTDLLSAINATSKDNISIESHISAVKVEITKDDDTTEDVWVPVRLYFSPAYGDHDRTLMESISVGHEDHVDAAGDERDKIEDTITASMKDNRILINNFQGNVKAVKFKARKDSSNGLNDTPQAKWAAKTEIIEIPDANPINTTISPDEMKDISALYQVDQLTKIMSIFKDVLGNYKDDTIKEKLDDSFETMDPLSKRHYQFDMAPTAGYALDPVTWRQKTFMDAFDSYVTSLLQVLNDPNMEITVFGRPDLIRKIKPTEYTYKSPEAIGPVPLDFNRHILTSDGRLYNFISSDKLKGSDQLIVLLKPVNTDRIVYRIYDYQMHISNDIRNAGNHTLPAINAYERWKFVEYQPVQARIDILNPTGLVAP